MTVQNTGTETAPNDPNTFKDGRGRTIKLRSLSVLEQMRLLRTAGGENSAYYNFCARLARVAEINGNPYPVPDKNVMFEAMAQTLGDDGLLALTLHLAPPDEVLKEEKSLKQRQEEAKTAEDKEKATIKN